MRYIGTNPQFERHIPLNNRTRSQHRSLNRWPVIASIASHRFHQQATQDKEKYMYVTQSHRSFRVIV